MKKNLLVTLADKNYINQAKQLFSSVYFKAGWQGDYLLLAHDIPEEDLKWFKDKGILIKRCKPLFDRELWYSFLPQGVLSPIVSIKFYLFTPEFKKWDQIIYLDADIIVRASLDQLAEIKGLGAINDIFNQKLKDQIVNNDEKLFKQAKKNYNLNGPSFNAGVLAFSTEIIQADTFFRLKELFKKYSVVSSCAEQTILNLFFYKKWKLLPPFYNLYFTDNRNQWYLKPERIKGIVLHFIGKNPANLPWQPTNYFYPEWKSNLDKADSINLENIPEGNKWTIKQISAYAFYLNQREILCRFWLVIGRYLGLIGIFLKNNFPKLYFSLKKLKDR